MTTRSDIAGYGVTYSGIISLKFMYDGTLREVDNVSVHKSGKTIVGFELRKGGKFSNKIKSYSLEKCGRMEQIEPSKRQGPIMGRP